MSDESTGPGSSEYKGAPSAEPAEHVAEPAEPAADDECETAQKKARLEEALRKYRATLRNEAETGNAGFSADDYKSQRPPHW